MKTGGEQCDDGNKISGDGCSTSCTEEIGYTCTSQLKLPTTAAFRVTYRDFKGYNVSGSHPDFEYNIVAQTGIVGAACLVSNKDSCGRLDVDGKPQLINTNRSQTAIKNADTFGLWYRDSNPAGIRDDGNSAAIAVSVVPGVLTLTQVASGSPEYTYSSDSYYPLDGTGVGLGNEGRTHNYHFTTELRYFFQYQGGETLKFSGDDDVWVFVNGRLAVDIGGVHGVRHGQVVLGDDGVPSAVDSNCSAHLASSLPATDTCYEATEKSDTKDDRFGLTKGQVYEIVLFHAERHTTESNFKLTLSGFLAPRSYCLPKCGDGYVAGGEACDDGANNWPSDTSVPSGKCNSSCTARAYCGDGFVQPGEICDNGKNTDVYLSSSGTNLCAPGCVAPAKCGDNIVQAAFEACDLGAGNSNTSYGLGACTTSCTYGPYCGDNKKNGTEDCDKGTENGGYGAGSCTYECKMGPYCGDLVRNGPEDCDGTANCSASCTMNPYCGDNIKQSTEACDWGASASTSYGTCNSVCTWNAHCGDGHKDSPYEECDEGANNSNTKYDGCRLDCFRGPHCGDGVTQVGGGEACDNGFNDDTYAFSTGACGAGCKNVPFCGDGIVQSLYELCDKGSSNNDLTYNGCNTKCEWGPYCGDGIKNGTEQCDKGLDNGGYGPGSCSMDCKTGPFCGDGVRNGAEECDGTSHCNPTTCKMDPYCGDNIKQSGEDCDWGAAAETSYGTCNSACKWNAHCGDGKLDSPEEQCDKGTLNNDDTYNGCRTDCLFGPRCGDGLTQTAAGEICDNGYNDDTYQLSSTACGMGCKPVPYCGDGVLQPLYEVCDRGPANSNAAYDGCTTTCDWGPYCGDGKLNGSEQCDLGLNNGGYGPTSCGMDCKFGPYCGDGIRNGFEDCDIKDPNAKFCSADCKTLAHCGDNILQPGEECDWGAAASSAYGACNALCTWNGHCGDGVVNKPAEECDLGNANNNNDTYNGCRRDCLFGPRCGDGVTQTLAGEICDNGYNDDSYQFSSNSCGSGCKPVPYCGDGVLQPLFELCDNGARNDDSAYDGCNTKCEWGPYCGDGKKDPTEVCDNGSRNTAYSSESNGCGYDCQPAPYCGDGERNGPEQCDLGKSQNTGAYGKCNLDCTLAPYCGDRVKQFGNGEECDDGPTGSTQCSPQCKNRGDIQ
jgi:fibro-slime domain-containing protein